MTKEELRQQAAISILNSLLETTQHSVVESIAIKDVYSHVAVMYADALINALEIDEEGIQKWIKQHAALINVHFKPKTKIYNKT